LKERVVRQLPTSILVVDPKCTAATFLAEDYGLADIAHGVNKILQIVKDLDPSTTYIKVILIKTILRYSFVKFDSRIWIVVGTNGLGRRAVPGFYVSQGGSWYSHFDDDIRLLMQRK
jgi:hypothetical protein